ncbi:MAG: hypothetical protein ACE5GV_09465 [Candidatus Scalindua sp.]
MKIKNVTLNNRKSIYQMLSLLHVLDCEFDLIVKDRVSATA